MNLSANVFVFGDFETSISNNLLQMVNFPTWIPDCHCHSSALLGLFISFDASICFTVVLLHWEILIMLLSQFPLTFHQIHNEMP